MSAGRSVWKISISWALGPRSVTARSIRPAGSDVTAGSMAKSCSVTGNAVTGAAAVPGLGAATSRRPASSLSCRCRPLGLRTRRRQGLRAWPPTRLLPRRLRQRRCRCRRRGHSHEARARARPAACRSLRSSSSGASSRSYGVDNIRDCPFDRALPLPQRDSTARWRVRAEFTAVILRERMGHSLRPRSLGRSPQRPVTSPDAKRIWPESGHAVDHVRVAVDRGPSPPCRLAAMRLPQPWCYSLATRRTEGLALAVAPFSPKSPGRYLLHI